MFCTTPKPKPNLIKTVDHIMKQFHHTHDDHHHQLIKPTQCCSCLTQTIDASIDLVWSLVRRFDKPQTYKRFIHSCCMLQGDGGVGSIREVHIASGLPAKSSIQRLDVLDDEMHVMSFSIVGGDQRLVNYKSIIRLHDNGKSTVVTESYVVDVPDGNTEEETRLLTDTIIKCNLKSLTEITTYSK